MYPLSCSNTRGGSRTAATSKVDFFVIIVNGFQPLTIITKSTTLDVASVLDPPLNTHHDVADFKVHERAKNKKQLKI